MTFRPDPFNDRPALPPKQDIETKAVLKACIETRAASAELRVSGQIIPNQALLINSIPLREVHRPVMSVVVFRPGADVEDCFHSFQEPVPVGHQHASQLFFAQPLRDMESPGT